MFRFGTGFIVGVGIAIFTASAANAKTYQFRVSCADETYIAQWDGSDFDKDRFRIATGDTNLDCSIYDYDARTDGNLPRRWCGDPGGIIRGFPPALILSGLSHCR
ncbi:MAG: hypothetical protein WDN46_03045 [Methylocella sp.]